MLTEYIKASLKRADYKKLEDGSWYAEIPGFTGVWANGESVEECRNELQEVLEEWLILKIRDKDPIPTVDGLDINIVEKAVA
jgi:predicted RNase H-like HicB family nuclease